jgi:hypothetical protein
MEDFNIWSELFKLGPVVALLGYAIYYLKNQLKEVVETKDAQITSLQNENKEYAKDYKSMAENAITVITLADDKLKNDAGNNEKINDIHRIVGETLDIIRKRDQIS